MDRLVHIINVLYSCKFVIVYNIVHTINLLYATLGTGQYLLLIMKYQSVVFQLVIIIYNTNNDTSNTSNSSG